MNRSIYNIVDIVNEIHSITNEFPGKKKFQKLVYLIENLGEVNLGYEYEIYFYGPYSSDLDESVTKLNGEGILYYSYEGNSHRVCLKEGLAGDDLFYPDLTDDEYARIKDIIEKFSNKSPSELELLTTTHYAFISLQDKSHSSVVAGVQKIKGAKFSEAQIENAIHELNIV